MNNEFFQAFIRVSVAQIALVCKYNKMKMSAVVLLGNLTYYFIRKCGLAIKNHSNESDLGEPAFDDAVRALELIDIRIDDIMHFIKGNRGFSYLYENIPMIIPTADCLDLPDIEEMSQLTFNADQEYDAKMPYPEESELPKHKKILFVVKEDRSAPQLLSENEDDGSPAQQENPLRIRFNVSSPPAYHGNDLNTYQNEEMESLYEDSISDQFSEENEIGILQPRFDEVLSPTLFQYGSHQDIFKNGQLSD